MQRRNILRVVLATFATLLCSNNAHAQEFPDYRLAAQLGVLRAQLQPLLEKEPTPIRQRLDLIERYGSLFLMWGC